MVERILKKGFECDLSQTWNSAIISSLVCFLSGFLFQKQALSHTCSQFPFLLIFAACVCFLARKSTLQLYGKEGLYQKALKPWTSQLLKLQSRKIPHKPVQTFLNKKSSGKITVSCGPSIYTQMNKTRKICRHKHLQIKLALRD